MTARGQGRYTEFETPAACWADAHDRMLKGRLMPWCVMSITTDPGWSGVHPDAIAPCDECGVTHDQALASAREAGAMTSMCQAPPDRWLCWQCAVQLAPTKITVTYEEPK